MGIWEYTLYFTTTTCLWSGKKPNGFNYEIPVSFVELLAFFSFALFKLF